MSTFCSLCNRNRNMRGRRGVGAALWGCGSMFSRRKKRQSGGCRGGASSLHACRNPWAGCWHWGREVSSLWCRDCSVSGCSIFNSTSAWVEDLLILLLTAGSDPPLQTSLSPTWRIIWFIYSDETASAHFISHPLVAMEEFFLPFAPHETLWPFTIGRQSL